MPDADDAATEDFYALANLSPKHTGLPFVVWIAINSGGSQPPCVKVSSLLRTTSASIAITSDVHVLSEAISDRAFELVRTWIELNRDVLIKYWNGDIAYNEDAIAALKPISRSMVDDYTGRPILPKAQLVHGRYLQGPLPKCNRRQM